MSDWPKYDSHKVVQAAKIVNFETRESGSRVCAIVDPGNGALEVFIPSVAEMLDETEVGGWALKSRLQSAGPRQSTAQTHRTSFWLSS